MRQIVGLIKKCPPIYKMANGVLNLVNKGYYRRLCSSHHFDEKLRALRKENRGRCFIIGNGPSLKSCDLDKLVHEDCFASNQIFRLFGDTDWRPKYYAVQDIYGGIAREVDSIDCEIVFVGDYYWRKIGTTNPNAICYHGNRVLGKNVPFSEDVARNGVYDSFTVTYALMQLAVNLGYKELILLGVDHSYRNTIRMDGTCVEDESAKNHFYEDSKAHPVLANVEAMERGYRAAKRYSDAHGIEIKDATRGGHLEIFPHIKFDDLFNLS